MLLGQDADDGQGAFEPLEGDLVTELEAVVLRGRRDDDAVGLADEVALGDGGRRDERALLDADQGQVDGLAAVVLLGVGEHEPVRRGIGDAGLLGELVDLLDIDDGARERCVRLGAPLEREVRDGKLLESGDAVVDESGGEAGQEDDEDGDERDDRAHECEAGAREP